MDPLFLIYPFKNLQYSNKFHILSFTRLSNRLRKFNFPFYFMEFHLEKYIFDVQFTNYSSAKFYSLQQIRVNISAFRKHVCRSPTFPKIQSSNIHLKVVGGYINLEQRLVKSSPHLFYPAMQMKTHQLNSRTQRSEQKAARLFFRRKQE